MEKDSLNYLTNRLKDRFNNLIIRFLSFCFLVFSNLLILSSIVVGQEVRNLDDYLNSLQLQKSENTGAEAERFRSLVYDLHPILFFNNGQMSNPLGGNPVCLTTDIKSIVNLYTPSELFNYIELITIIIDSDNDLTAEIDISRLESFSNLKHIYFLSRTNLCSQAIPACEIPVISKMISGDSDAQIVYKVVTSN